MSELIFNKHDLVSLSKSLLSNRGTVINTDPHRWQQDTPGYTEIFTMWKEAEFNVSSIEWINYYPEKDFNNDIVTDAADFLELSGIHRSWISRINPGYYAPWHWDVDDNENEYLKKGEIKRYTITMSNPTIGHIFILNDDYHFNKPSGTILKWKNYKDWHAGINGGLTPKFMFHLIGY
jgi:hypothetical protein